MDVPVNKHRGSRLDILESSRFRLDRELLDKAPKAYTPLYSATSAKLRTQLFSQIFCVAQDDIDQDLPPG